MRRRLPIRTRLAAGLATGLVLLFASPTQVLSAPPLAVPASPRAAVAASGIPVSTTVAQWLSRYFSGKPAWLQPAAGTPPGGTPGPGATPQPASPGGPAAPVPSGHGPVPSLDGPYPYVPEAERVLMNLINAERAREGLLPLTPDPVLTEFARERALDLVVHHVFTHNTPDYGYAYQMERARGMNRSTVGGDEVLAAGPTPVHIFYQLMGSPPHRLAMMYPGHRSIGVGVIRGRHALVVSVLFTN